jgi:hypothetical protein
VVGQADDQIDKHVAESRRGGRRWLMMIDPGDLISHIRTITALYPGVGRTAGVRVLVTFSSIAFSKCDCA